MSDDNAPQRAGFLPARRYASAVFATATCLSVCLSVCPSVTRRYCASQSESRIVKCTPSDSPMIPVSDKIWVVEKFARVTPKERAKWGWGRFFRRFSTNVVISRKRCILDTKLLWDGNMKPYASYRMVSVSMTLSDPWPGFQGHGSFKRRVYPKRRILQTQLLYRTLIGNHTQAIDRQASYTAYNPLLLKNARRRVLWHTTMPVSLV